MKKLIGIITIMSLIIALSGCASLNITSNETTKSAAQIEQENFQQAKNVVISKLKDNLKNPESLQVHDIQYKNTPPAEDSEGLIDMDCKYVMKIDYSAQNGFGGMNRETIYALYHNDGTVSLSLDADNNVSAMKYLLTYSQYTYVEK